MRALNKLEWNCVKYIDCMNPYEGLSSLPNKSIDLGITDPPWNKNYKGIAGSHDTRTRRRKTKTTIFYADNREDYEYWCFCWFKELERICKRILIYISKQHISMWCRIHEPDDWLIWYKPNSGFAGGKRLSTFNAFDVCITYNISKCFTFNIVKINTEGGGLHVRNYKHPCPTAFNFWYFLIKNINPVSVIDPFFGSGVTGEVCIKLGIPFLAFEINPIYEADWKLRSQVQKSKKTKQITFEGLKKKRF